MNETTETTETAETTEMHWHVETGLQGYGPEAETPTFYPLTEDSALQAVSDELNRAADSAHELAMAIGDQAYDPPEHWTATDADLLAQFREAWRELKRSDHLATMAANTDPSRSQAPLYSANPFEGPQLWAIEVRRLLSEANTEDLSHNSRLYVWQCSESECTEDPTD